MLTNHLASGTGKFHSDGGKTPKPLNSITLGEIKVMLEEPQAVDKASAQWAIFSSLQSRSRAKQVEQGVFYAGWADLDKCEGLGFDDIVRTVTGAILCNAWIYNSRSATADNCKVRLIVPFAEPVQGKDFAHIQQIINDRIQAAGIEPDPKNLTANQICYLPNKGEVYRFESCKDVGDINPITDWADDLAMLRAAKVQAKADLEAKREQARLNTIKRQDTNQLSPIDALTMLTHCPCMFD